MSNKVADRLALALVPSIGSFLIRSIGWSISFEWVNVPPPVEGVNAIFTFWHGRMLMMPLANRYGAFSMMVSRHKDGELISRTIKRLGIGSTRGSSTRGGMAALKEVIRLARAGVNIGFTPDGPKGPRHTVQMGVIQAAKATGLPIHPVSYSARKKKLLKPGMAS